MLLSLQSDQGCEVYKSSIRNGRQKVPTEIAAEYERTTLNLRHEHIQGNAGATYRSKIPL